MNSGFVPELVPGRPGMSSTQPGTRTGFDTGYRVRPGRDFGQKNSQKITKSKGK